MRIRIKRKDLHCWMVSTSNYHFYWEKEFNTWQEAIEYSLWRLGLGEGK